MVIRSIIHFGMYMVSLLFRMQCKRVGRRVMIGPGYSFIACHLENVAIGDGVLIGSNAWIQTVPTEACTHPQVLISENVSIGRNVVISAAKSITISSNTLISYGVSLLDHDHEYRDLSQPPLRQGISQPEPITIGEDCFIGAHAFILKGVTLGKHCVVGANSVVTRSFPDNSLIVGNPARVVRALA